MDDKYDEFEKWVKANANWWDDSDSKRRTYSVYDKPLGYESPKSKTKHEFSPVLLVFSTVFNCKHCGINKEDAKSDYCDGTTNDDMEWEIGGW